MSWSGGTYTKGNSGTGGWSGDATAGIGIEAGRHDTQDNDFASGINNTIAKDGQNTPTNNLPMGGYKHTGVANASANDQYAAWGQLRNGAPVFLDTTNTRLGVGTSSPQTLIDAVGGAVSSRGSAATSFTSIEAQSNTYYSGPSFQSTFIGQSGASAVGTTAGLSNAGLGVVAFQNTSAGLIYTNGAADIAIATSATERMRFASGGNIGIGTTSPAFRLHVNSTSNTVAPGAFNSTAAGDSTNLGLVVTKADNVNTAGSNYLIGFWINAGATASGRIATNGANAAAFFSTSDVTLKENIVDLPSQLGNILALRPVEFDFKDGSGHQIGFIAQEVEQVYPDNVATDPDGIKSVGDMSRNYARLVKAFQEQHTYVQSLEARIQALENA